MTTAIISDEAAIILISGWYKATRLSASEVKRYTTKRLRTKESFVVYETTMMKHDGTNWYLETDD